ncbi:MAG: hypothetical protein O3A51_12470 [Verrucomicrobia bacterium]|nr:hypothetical protein [Verrucomicrobiota bacterium]
MFKSLDKWLVGYLASIARRPHGVAAPRHLLFCLADHYEPFRGGVSAVQARATVAAWGEAYPASVARFRDADGVSPQHTFFYPQEDYDAPCLDRLADLCRRGAGEVEVHLHHRHDTPDGLRAKLTGFRDVLHREHGLLGCDAAGQPRYGFIHGNWALCNSRPDGDWCGVNNELGLLAETGCYADFTFPSAPSPTQSRQVNAIYRARDRAGHPRGYDRGVELCVRPPAGPGAPADALLMVTGPLALNWKHRKWGLLPRLENGDLTGANPPTLQRAHLWTAQQLHVRGRPDWVFVKLYTHGCVPANQAMLLGAAMQQFHADLQARYNDGRAWQLHYVTARELVNIIHAAERGESGSPAPYRDIGIQSPAVRSRR